MMKIKIRKRIGQEHINIQDYTRGKLKDSIYSNVREHLDKLTFEGNREEDGGYYYNIPNIDFYPTLCLDVLGIDNRINKFCSGEISFNFIDIHNISKDEKDKFSKALKLIKETYPDYKIIKNNLKLHSGNNQIIYTIKRNFEGKDNIKISVIINTINRIGFGLGLVREDFVR